MNLLIIGFLVSFAMFLAYVVDWSFINHPATAANHPKLSQVIHWEGLLNIPWTLLLVLCLFGIVWGWQLLRLAQDLPNLQLIRHFYNHILEIDEEDVVNVEFGEIVDKLYTLQRQCPITNSKLDAKEICNRLMRRENYLVALFNKEVLNVDSPLRIRPSSTLTKTLEWNLSFCILNYFFDERGNIKSEFLKDVRREKISEELRRRFVAVGVANLIFSPFILLMMGLYLIFKYGEGIYRNPRTVATRQYGTAARWRLREFNELPHLFERRLSHTNRKATKYMEQFSQSRWTWAARLVSFVTGSVAVVLLALTILNEDLLMHFEITSGKSIIWYLGFMGLSLAISRAMIPDATKAHDPQKLMEDIIEYTHYLPKHWRGRLHTRQVQQEFGQFYDYKFLILFQELLSVLITPFILIFALPKCSDRLVNFFREFTVHVDGLGYVCSFALFDFERHGSPKYGGRAPNKQQQSRQEKMEKSFRSFVSNNPNWVPDDEGSYYLNKIEEFNRTSPIMMTKTKLTMMPRVPSFSGSPDESRSSPLNGPHHGEEEEEGNNNGEDDGRFKSHLRDFLPTK